MKTPFNDLKREYKSIQADIDAKIKAVIDNTAFIKGVYCKEFEDDFASYCGTSFCVGSSSGTTAIHLALMAFGIEKGDEVITVSNTFIGTTEPITHAGAKIVFVDIDEKTYNIDPQLIESAITPKTKAIVPVHLYGQMVNIESVCKIAKKHDLIVIEDAAQAVGGEYKERKAGYYGDAACFSFYPGKNLGAYGDAGCVVTNDEKAARQMRMLADHGRLSKYEHEMEGYNYRMDALQAAVLTIKLKHIDDWNNSRKKVAHFYSEHLNKEKVSVPYEDPDSNHCFHIYCTRVNDRDSVMSKLKEKEVSSGIHYPIPLHLQLAYEHLDLNGSDLKNTEKIAGEILSLPIFPFMTQEEIEYVVESVNKVV